MCACLGASSSSDECTAINEAGLDFESVASGDDDD